MVKTINSLQLAEFFIHAEKSVSSKKEVLNSLNVYPVPDGDTGTNMSLTLKEVVKNINPKEKYTLQDLSEKIAYASLMGARGNSGVILSQFIGGFCQTFKGKKTIDKKTFLSAFENGTEEAYKSVSDPVEGTILTIMKSATEELKKQSSSEDIVQMLKSAVNRAQFTLKKTPDMLQKLKDAGVVDAGGAGFVYFLEGFHKVFKNNGTGNLTATDDFTSPQLARVWEERYGAFGMGGIRAIIDFNSKVIKATISNTLWILGKGWSVLKMGKNLISLRKAIRVTRGLAKQIKTQNIKKTNIAILKLLQVWQETPNAKYCTNVILSHSKRSLTDLKKDLQKIGTSLVLAQSKDMTKIHIHVNEKETITKFLKKEGKIESLKIDNIHEQHEEFIGKKFEEKREEKPTCIVAVINAKGFKQIYESFEGVITIDGGKTMNPSVSQFNDALSKSESVNVIILPNNKNVFLAAQHAASHSSKNVKVLGTIDQAQGLTALLNFNKSSMLTENFELMNNSLTSIITFSITKSIRDTVISGVHVKKDSFISVFDNGKVILGKSIKDVTINSIKTIKKTFQLITLYYGSAVKKEEATLFQNELTPIFPCEFQLYEGGQPNYYYIVSVE